MRWIALLMSLSWGPWAVSAPIDFALPDMEGNTVRLSDYRGKWVVANYWATWCPPCRDEIPELQAFHDAHKDRDAVVLGINIEQVDDRRLRAFIEEMEMRYPVLLQDQDTNIALPRPFGLPTTYLITPAGEIIETHVGPLNREQLEKMLDGVRGGPAKPSVQSTAR